jgi:hypothetical protein
MRRVILPFLLLIGLMVVAYFIFRPQGAAAYGAQVALCPGPDFYGYTCDNGDTFAYINAGNDTQLYRDDGTIEVDLPFPFNFYGRTYEAVTISSNGNLQFTSNDAVPFNECFNEAVVDGLGDLIAPYWDDLDLTLEGTLDTEVVGEAPNRIFVVEWDDVPYFGDAESKVTFEVQLFEANDNILFLYQDVGQGQSANGRSATVGIQREDAGLGLMFGCNNASVTNGKGLLWVHPEDPNRRVQGGVGINVATESEVVFGKGNAGILANTLNQQGKTGIQQLQQQQLSKNIQTQYQWLDIVGDNQPELVWLQRSTQNRPDQSQLIVLGQDNTNAFQILLDWQLSTRNQPILQPSWADTGEILGQNKQALLLRDQNTLQSWLILGEENVITHHPLPTNCKGNIGLVEPSNNGTLAIAQNGCDGNQRVIYSWSNGEFSIISN